ncbi:MAG: Fe-S cluster assembly protein SufD, partial [Chloroflexales bacterium]
MTNLTLRETTADVIGTRAQAAGEPGWLAERRRDAWTLFAQAGPPEWRRTDLSGLLPDELGPTDTTAVELIGGADLAALGVVFKPSRQALD